MSAITPKSLHGFNTAVLSQNVAVKPPACNGSVFSETAKNPGYFLVSIHCPHKSLPKPKGKKAGGPKTRNRKTITTDGQITYNGDVFIVNARKSGLYVDILKRMIEQFEVALILWRRVFVLRFDLHQDVYSPDSKCISVFIKRIRIKLKRKYGFKKVGFCWVREKERAKAQHYHVVLFLDGHRVKHSKRIMEMIRQAWETSLGGFHVPHISRPFYFGTRDEIAAQVVYRISYMAKARGKGYRDKQAKDFQCSRMKL